MTLVMARLRPTRMKPVVSANWSETRYICEQIWAILRKTPSLAYPRLLDHAVDLAHHPHGTWLLQEAIETGTVAFHARLLEKLSPGIGALCTCMHGNFVIQALIRYAHIDLFEPIVQALREQVWHYATNVCGCRIYCRLVEMGMRLPALQALVDELLQRPEQLVFDQYGHFVIEMLLEHGRPEDVKKIVGFVERRLDECIRNRFAIFVVSECIYRGSRGDPEIHRELAEKLTSDPELIGILHTTPGRFSVALALWRTFRSPAVEVAGLTGSWKAYLRRMRSCTLPSAQ